MWLGQSAHRDTTAVTIPLSKALGQVHPTLRCKDYWRGSFAPVSKPLAARSWRPWHALTCLRSLRHACLWHSPTRQW
ncbi:Uncharacterised protein [Vibrio cholerae]|nr:Uncharacterised protein [Vibrio cholerae]